MTSQTFIEENKTTTLKKGDQVVMHTCAESTFEKYKDKVWTCRTDSYLDKAKQEVVFLDGFSGCFAVQYLKKVECTNFSKAKGDLHGECYRTACANQNAVYYNHSTQKHYCWHCAGLINDANMSDSLRMYGHELCQHFSQVEKLKSEV